MEWTWPERVMSNRQRVVEQLVQGREMANQLQMCINGEVRSAEGLVTKILGSFTDTLHILNGSQQEAANIEANNPTNAVTAYGSSSGSGFADAGAGAGADSSSWDAADGAVKSVNSTEKSYKSATRETFKDRRGSYRRRKTSHSWTKDTVELVDDGHAWRKYGQKMILNTRHPRNYFRCTHKFDQGCKATKHEQRIADEPQLFRTTYYGNHTCIDYIGAPECILNFSSSLERSSKNMIRFDTSNNDFTCKQEHPFFSSFRSIKKESVKEEEMITPISECNHAHQNQSSSLCDHLMSPSLGVFESSGHSSGLSSPVAYDLHHLISRMMMGYFENELEEDFLYDF